MVFNRFITWILTTVAIMAFVHCTAQTIPWGSGRKITPVKWSTRNKASGINVNFTDTLTWRSTSTSGIGIANVGYGTGNRYWEIIVDVVGGNVQMMGLTTIVPTSSNTNILGQVNASIGWRGQSAGVCIAYNFGSNSSLGTGCTAIAAGQRISFAHNADSGIVRIFVNGALQTTALTGVPTGVTWYPACGCNVSIGSGGTAVFDDSDWAYNPNGGLLSWMSNYKMINE